MKSESEQSKLFVQYTVKKKKSILIVGIFNLNTPIAKRNWLLDEGPSRVKRLRFGFAPLEFKLLIDSHCSASFCFHF